MGEGITHLGERDPRKGLGSDKLHPLLASFLKALERDDDPASRAYPANITILRGLIDALDVDDPQYGSLNAHVIDLIIVAFFWLLRPAEYTLPTTAEARTQAFQYRHIYLTIDDTVYCAPAAPLNDANVIPRIREGCLEFADQKNAVKGEQVGHRANADPFFCPVKALGRIARRLHLARAPPDTPIYQHYNDHPDHRGWHSVKSTFITTALRHSAARLEKTTGIPANLLSARSLRPGGATALLCARVDPDAIQLLGRWKSDAMFRYLRIQAAAHAHNYAQLMLDHGAYTFTPTACARGAAPKEAPAKIHQLLAHDELYS